MDVDFVTYLLIEASMASEDAGQQNGRNVDLKTEEKQATLVALSSRKSDFLTATRPPQSRLSSSENS